MQNKKVITCIKFGDILLSITFTKISNKKNEGVDVITNVFMPGSH